MIKQLDRRFTALKTDHDDFLPLYRDISKYVLPWAGRFVEEGTDKNIRNYKHIVDDTGTKAVVKLAAGIMNDTMSPTEEWFSLAIDGSNVDLDHASKAWLDDATELMMSVLAKSNAYGVAQQMIELIAGFGTACAFIDDDVEKVIHLHLFEPGEFYIATNSRGMVDTVYREFNMTVAQLVDMFGIDNVSDRARNLYNKGTLDTQILVRHAIEPRLKRDATSKLAKDMKFKSCYWEVAGNNNRTLRESGFKRFPCLVPRWAVFSQNAYGNSPGFQALGAIKQLQLEQTRKSEAIDYQVKPPIQVPASMKNRENEYFPGGISYYDATAGAIGGVKTAFEVRLDLSALREDIQDVRNRIDSAFFGHLFTLITDVDRQTTAYEVAAREQEKATLLGPVARRLNNELHTQLINILFERMFDAELFETPPESMQGQVLNVVYKSAFEDAAKAKTVAGLDRFFGIVANVAQFAPQSLDKVDIDKIIDAYADGLGVDPDVLAQEDAIQGTREARAQQQQQAQQQAQALELAKVTANAPAQGTVMSTAMEKVGINAAQASNS